MPAGDGAGETVSVAAEALGSTTQGLYVVTQNGADAYCDATLYAGNHGAAIQACIDKASLDGGGRVLVRGGTYSNGTWPLTLKSNVTLAGEGHLAAKFAPTAGQIVGTMQDKSAVEGIVFDTTAVSEGAIRLGAAAGAHADLRFENNKFVLANPAVGNFYGIYSPDGANSLSHIAVRGNLFQVSQAATSILFPVYCKVTSGGGTLDFVRVENNDFFKTSSGSTNAVVLLADTATTPSLGLAINGNTMRGATWAYGALLSGTLDAQMTGNTIQAVARPVSLSPGAATSCGITVTANSFRGGSTPGVTGICKSNSIVVGNTSSSPDLSIGKAPILVRAYRNGSQTFTAGTDTVLAYNAEDVDNGGNLDAGTGTFTAPVGGVYRARACVRFATTNFAAGDTADVFLRVNGATTSTASRLVSGGSTGFTNCAEDLVVLASGNTLQTVVNASGAATSRTIIGVTRSLTYLSIERVSD